MSEARIVWRRLDAPGHDGCTLDPSPDGWLLAGTAVFAEKGEPGRLDYSVACDVSWATLRGVVTGWVQRYERLDERLYRYQAPRFDYSATLEVDPVGFVHDYPGLWRVEAPGP